MTTLQVSFAPNRRPITELRYHTSCLWTLYKRLSQIHDWYVHLTLCILTRTTACLLMKVSSSLYMYSLYIPAPPLSPSPEALGCGGAHDIYIPLYMLDFRTASLWLVVRGGDC